MGPESSGEGAGVPLATSLALAIESDGLPARADLHLRLGRELQRQGDLVQALGHYLRVAQLEPTSVAAWCGIGSTMEDRNHFEDALVAYRRALDIAPDVPDAHCRLGRAYLRAEKLPEAADSLHAALRLKPDLAEAWNALGSVAEMQGNLAQATVHRRQAIGIDPTLADAYAGLPHTGDGALDEADVRRLQGLLDKDGLDAGAAISLRFVLAQYHDRHDDHETAFALAVEANRLSQAEFARIGRSYDVGVHQHNIDKVIKVFDEGHFARCREFGNTSRLPVFVLGLPRSGTTLLEQVLASHPQVHGGGERNDLLSSLFSLREKTGHSEANALDCVSDMDEAVASALAVRYLTGVRELGGQALRVTNKAPGNFPLVGFLWTLLPKATLFDCRRDPLDVAVSCFFTDLRRIPWACDLHFIASVIRDHSRMMKHWQRVVPATLLEVRYEDMVADCEAVSRRAVAHCGLDWDERCLSFYQNRRPVFNASRRQVRRPIYRESVGRWRHYERHLAPIFEAIRPG